LSITQKEKTIVLRKKENSYGEISEIINIPKSTLAFWLKDINFSEKAKRILSKKI